MPETCCFIQVTSVVTQFPDVESQRFLWCVGVSQSGPDSEVTVVGFFMTVPIRSSCLLLITGVWDYGRATVSRRDFPRGSRVLIP